MILKKAEMDRAHFLWKREKSALCVFPISKAGLFKLAMLQRHPNGWTICSQISLSEVEIDELQDFSLEKES